MTDPHSTSLGARLRERRQQMRYSQRELAELMGKKQTTLHDWETGRSEPSLVNISILARILEVSPHWLAFGVDTPTAAA